METLIKEALNNAYHILDKQVPQTKTNTIRFDVFDNDITPFNVGKFIEDNKIPDTAYFGGVENSYDAYESFALCYDVRIPTSDMDKLKFKELEFARIASNTVYTLLTKNGYKRVGYDSKLVKEFNNRKIYNMFTDQDFEGLVKYYSLAYIKIS